MVVILLNVMLKMIIMLFCTYHLQ